MNPLSKQVQKSVGREKEQWSGNKLMKRNKTKKSMKQRVGSLKW